MSISFDAYWFENESLLAACLRRYEETGRPSLTGQEMQAITATYRPLRVRPRWQGGKMSMTTTCAIVGAGYHPGASEKLRQLDRDLARDKARGWGGSKLVLVRQPDNPHDKNAVAVHFLGQMLGYIPRQDAKVVARVMDNGVDVRTNYSGQSTCKLWWPAETKEGVDAVYRRAMNEFEGL